MQNSPLLVTKTSPVNNMKPSVNQAPSKPSSDSFENVLSKRVKQNETQGPATRNSNANEGNASKEKISTKVDDQQTKADTTVDEPVNVAEELLKILAGSVAVKDEGLEATVDAQSLAMEATVDAQTLAMEVTTKTLEEVTDGKVTIDPPQEARVLQASLSNFVPVTQRAIQQATSNTSNVADLDALEPLKQAVVETGKDAVASGKAEEDGNRLQGNASQAIPLKETNEKLNPRFANVLASESKQQASAETLIETNKAPADVAAMTLQTAATKPAAAPFASSPLQAGASNMINAFPGKAGWSDAVNQKVVWMVGAAEQSATLTLNPKDLGPLQVIINVNNEKADATFISENPEVRKALEEGMSSLRSAMGQTGVELGQANVNTSKQHQEFQQANKETVARQTNQNDAELSAEQLANDTINTRVSNGLVDTFV